MGNFNRLIVNNNKHIRMNPATPYTIYDREAISTYAYIAPETYNTKCIKDTSMDVWSLGCILYELVTGQCLFDDVQREAKSCDECEGYLDYIKGQHRQLDRIMTKMDQISGHPAEKNIMKQIFVRESYKRPSVKTLLNILSVDYIVPKNMKSTYQ